MSRHYCSRLGSYVSNSFIFLTLLTPLAAASQSSGTSILETATSSINLGQGHPVPCGWSAIFDASHPERPPQLAAATGALNCGSRRGKPPLVKVAASLSMIYTTKDASASIRVIALEAGSVGDIIRCRSSIDGAVLTGRISDTQTIEMLPRDRKIAW